MNDTYCSEQRFGWLSNKHHAPILLHIIKNTGHNLQARPDGLVSKSVVGFKGAKQSSGGQFESH